MSHVRIVDCFHCEAKFDRIRSRWCECLRSTRTLVCPACGRCSCDAPVAWQVAHGTMTRRPLRPLRDASTPGSGEPKEREQEAGRRLRLLVVDDDRFVQHLLREGFAGQFDVTVATNGLEGLAMARELRPDVVVTDALMPGLDGRQLCLTLKSDPSTSGIRVIIMTSVYKSTRHEGEALKHFRADAFLRKPVTISKIAETVAAVAAPGLIGRAS